MIKKIFLYVPLLFVFSQIQQANADLFFPLDQVAKVTRDARANVKKHEQENNEKHIDEACKKGNFFSRKKHTLRSRKGAVCRGTMQGSYVLLVCDNGRDKSFYKSHCFKKAVHYLDYPVSKENTQAGRAQRHQHAARHLERFLEYGAQENTSEYLAFCQVVKSKNKKGAPHPKVTKIDALVAKYCK